MREEPSKQEEIFVQEIEYTELDGPTHNNYDQPSQLQFENSQIQIPASAVATPMREVSETPQRQTIGRKEPVKYSPQQMQIIQQQRHWQPVESSEEEEEKENGYNVQKEFEMEESESSESSEFEPSSQEDESPAVIAQKNFWINKTQQAMKLS